MKSFRVNFTKSTTAFARQKSLRLALQTVFTLTIFVTMEINAQVRVAPLALYLNEQERTGRIIVENTANESRLIELSVRFGYPVSNEQGTISMLYKDTVDVDDPSAAAWIRFYPQRLVLPPGAQQTIRFAVRPPAHVPDGEYWARPIIASRAVNSESENLPKVKDGITASIGIVYQTVISVNYRQGKVQTGVEIRDLQVRKGIGTLVVLADLARVGNAAYLGNMRVRLLNRRGTVVRETANEIAVYRTMRRRVEVAIGNLPAGSYTIELELNTNRQGNTPGDILQAKPVTKTVAVTIP